MVLEIAIAQSKLINDKMLLEAKPLATVSKIFEGLRCEYERLQQALIDFKTSVANGGGAGAGGGGGSDAPGKRKNSGLAEIEEKSDVLAKSLMIFVAKEEEVVEALQVTIHRPTDPSNVLSMSDRSTCHL